MSNLSVLRASSITVLASGVAVALSAFAYQSYAQAQSAGPTFSNISVQGGGYAPTLTYNIDSNDTKPGSYSFNLCGNTYHSSGTSQGQAAPNHYTVTCPDNNGQDEGQATANDGSGPVYASF